jgi:DNA transformation protein and related proteins
MADPFVAHCLELLDPLGAVRAKRMFGGHGLYIDELFMAIIAFNRLYLKADPLSRPQFEAAGCQPFVYEAKGKAMSMSYWSAPEDAMESQALMQPWARLAIAAAVRARAAKPAAAASKPRAAPRKAAAEAVRKKPARKKPAR